MKKEPCSDNDYVTECDRQLEQNDNEDRDGEEQKQVSVDEDQGSGQHDEDEEENKCDEENKETRQCCK